ncbi:RNA-binding transcriptional accessory protein [Phocaeicola coprophilus]|uniref:Tex-like protein N-terminal domain protein n=1 Tax=Phocaeicola coprophilus DSM 18228 = JCM 13818 TaxID=547042 RepID=S0F817_9BACT|nr:Tex family protein [Phocaeicola coprophilus]EEF75912.1 Tex-like protein N-terminal domain protein [Phocaeicola coprophilus DSM 18228 = JCM 13818]QRO25550.1 RNA-binding transcriptional accessory protein [Phocaeicola coprophilus]
MEQFSQMIADALKLPVHRVENTLKLLQGGATIPFISRYRKEATGGLDEVQISEISSRYEKLLELSKRKETIQSTIESLGKLTDDLRRRIDGCWDATELEDIYLPYKPKRKTRAEAARQKGLEPLAAWLMLQRENALDAYVKNFVKGEVKNEEDALKGARDIIAEQVNEDEQARNQIRHQFSRQAVISAKVVKGKETDEAAAKYRDYFDFSEPLKRCSSHRLLAIRRGEAEGILKVSITPSDETECTDRLERRFVRGNNECSRQVCEAVNDAYKRLLKPAIETEFAALSKEKADDEAIRVFAGNLRQLLLAPPLGQKRVLGIDPGFRTGCKVVCLDAQGTLLHNEAIYPHPPKSEYQLAGRKLVKLVEQYRIEAIAIGNGTASRETEQFVTSQRFDREIQVFVVSEDGASIYSASKTARDEFPDYDVTVRGAVSIGRRLMDPLAELVKIDAKSIGVGQYQHDVDQTKLKEALDQTVESCVNLVGVNVNTASSHLLTYVSGLGPVLAKNIVDYRTANGPFRSRRELLKVPRMGAKAFEQCAGFLRIPHAENPLDNSAVHPESYPIVERMAADLHCSVSDLIANRELRSRISPEKYVTDTVGLPTLTDILQELEKPGRDPRQKIQVFEFDKNVRTIDDVQEGMELPGIVTNITNFGCFVDLGIKEKGLIHVSQLADRFVSDPTTVVSIHQHVRVRVIGVDRERKRIALTMKGM